MNVIIIQSPLVQLNSPYPSGAYLNSFFKKQGCNSKWFDFSLELFYSIFSSKGLKTLFELTEKKALSMADSFEKQGDFNSSFNIRRYISCKNSWIEWIDFITDNLCDGKKDFSSRELCHKFLYSPFAPRGARMENYLAGLDREVDVDDVRFLCSFAIADLADYITAVFDQNFSLIRYAESLTVDTSSFAQIEQKIESPVMKTFFLPVIESLLQSQFVTSAEKLLILISVPFAGTFVPALYCSKILKKAFGKKAFICLGGGFINTELRQADDISLSKYIDAISYDRGYGSYKVLLKKNPFSKEFENLNESFYKLRLFKKDKVIEPLWNDKEIQKFEDDFTVENVPDFSDIDFSRYPRLCDDKNPMHRMWSDGTWIKAYLAHGCYWHKCAFCDTKLDYVCSYKITDVEKLYNGLYQTAVQKGVYGIHFVDEALPPKSLKEFALLNAKNQNKLYFWGNIRFEKSFTKDFAAFLSYCGFGSVSAGIENATSGGLQSINKGIDVSSIVKACAAFKESGILVHAYMIYGFWNDTAQSIIDSMETLRQFFAAGLLDSAFWHKFVLTRNSTVYSEWEKGLCPELKVIDNVKTNKNIFARNNLNFEGEEKFNKYGPVLDSALDSWMHGQKLNMNVQKWFDFQLPKTTVSPDFVEKEIESYEKNNQNLYAKKLELTDLDNIYFIGGRAVISKSNGNSLMRYIYLLEEVEISGIDDDAFVDVLEGLRPESSEAFRSDAILKIKSSPKMMSFLQKLRGNGLVLI